MWPFENSLSTRDSPNLIEILREPLKSHKKSESLSPPIPFKYLVSSRRLFCLSSITWPRWQADLFFKSASQTEPAKGKGGREGSHTVREEFIFETTALPQPFSHSRHFPLAPLPFLGEEALTSPEFVERKRPTSWLDLTRLHLAHRRLSSRKVNALPHVARSKARIILIRDALHFYAVLYYSDRFLVSFVKVGKR